MKRREKYPDTDIFRFYNANPRNRITPDCVVRAISKAYGQTWQKTWRDLMEITFETGYCPIEKKGFELYLERRGAKKMKQPRKADNTKFTLAEFIAIHHVGTFVVSLPSHLTVVKDGVCYDTADWTRSNRRVGNYWVI